MISKAEDLKEEDQHSDSVMDPQELSKELARIQTLISFADRAFPPTNQAVVFLGPSGAGKSTLFSYLLQPEYLFAKEIEDNDDPLNDRLVVHTRKPLGKIEIGHGPNSTTTEPCYWQDGKDITYWDCPGLRDTRGVAQEIENGYYVTKLFQNIEATKIVLVISKEELQGTRTGAFLNVLKELSSFFVDLNSLRQGMCVIATKIDKKHGPDAIKKRFATTLKDHKGSLDPKQKELLEFLASEECKIGCFPKPDGLGDLNPTDASSLNTLISNLSFFAPKVQITLSPDSLVHLENLAKNLNLTIFEKCARNNRELKNHLKTLLAKDNAASNILLELTEIRYQLEIISRCTNPLDFALQYDNLLAKFGIVVKKKLSEFVDKLDFIKVLKSDIEYSLERWANQFDVQKSIQELLEIPKVKHIGSILQIEGPILTSSGVMKKIQASQNVDSVTIFSGVFYLEPEGELKLSGIDLQVVTNTLFIPTVETTIDLSGKDGLLHAESKAPAVQGQNVDGSGMKGNDGLPGLPGENGGNLYLSALKISNPDKLTINVSGGKGGRGQDGGDGTDGANGADGSFDDVDKRKAETLVQRRQIPWSERHGFWNCTASVSRAILTFNSQVIEDYKSLGQPGQKGGDAGVGGPGGFGGKHGEFKHYIPANLAHMINIVSKNGDEGDRGKNGLPGAGGTDGTTWRGKFLNEVLFLPLRHKEKRVDIGEQAIEGALLGTAGTVGGIVAIDSAKIVTKELLVTTATTTAQSGLKVAGGFAAGLGVGIGIQTASSWVSSYVNSSWKEKPHALQGSRAADGLIPTNSNSLEKKSPLEGHDISNEDIQRLNDGHSIFLKKFLAAAEIY